MIFKFRERKINYSDSGSGEVIVLLHGYLESSEVWGNFEKKLSADFRVISIDLPGHGQSDIYGETHSMEFMATVLKDLINDIGIKIFFLVGHSLGGYVALAFLELFPKYLSGYCLFHSHPLADSPDAVKNRNREIKLVEEGKKDLMYPANVTKMFATANVESFSDALQISKTIASSIPAEGIIAVLRGMIVRPSRLNLMESGIAPCLWILGSMDNHIPCEAIQSKVKLPLNAKVSVLEKSGHMGFIEETDKSVKIITDFVNRLD